MSSHDVAAEVLRCVGGKRNVLSNSLCMTRLRLHIANPTLVNHEELRGIDGVLGTANRGPNGIEVVFGPNAVVKVYDAFVELTGIPGVIEQDPAEPDGEASATEGGPSASDAATSPSGTAGSSARPADAHADLVTGGAALADDEAEDLARLLESADDDDDLDDDADDDAGIGDLDADDADEAADEGAKGAAEPVDHAMRLLVLNGPNINMLGIREPVIYGREDFSALLYTCKTAAKEAGFVDCFCYQSNHEGDLVDKIQDAYQVFDGIIINPGAYTHTSIAILDALKAVSIPTIEVHISAVDEREDFRQVSYVRAACFETIMGMGIEGYRKAIFDMADHLGMKY